MYEGWLVKHGKAYNGVGEKGPAVRDLQGNPRYIDEHNRPENSYSYQPGLTRLADLSNEEHRAAYLGVKPGQRAQRPIPGRRGREAAENVDWREKDAVAPVKDQGSCEQT